MEEKSPDKLNRKYVVLFIAVFVVVLAGFGVLSYSLFKKSPEITSFKECVDAGYPIQMSYPEVCAADGKSFTNS